MSTRGKTASAENASHIRDYLCESILRGLNCAKDILPANGKLRLLLLDLPNEEDRTVVDLFNDERKFKPKFYEAREDLDKFDSNVIDSIAPEKKLAILRAKLLVKVLELEQKVNSDWLLHHGLTGLTTLFFGSDGRWQKSGGDAFNGKNEQCADIRHAANQVLSCNNLPDSERTLLTQRLAVLGIASVYFGTKGK